MEVTIYLQASMDLQVTFTLLCVSVDGMLESQAEFIQKETR